MAVRGAHERIVREVVKLNGVVAGPHRFGGTELRLGRRELGHIHGDNWADIAFPIEVRNGLIAEGKAEPHHILPESGWITFRFKKEADQESAIELFRLSYELARKVLSRTELRQPGFEPNGGRKISVGRVPTSGSSEASLFASTP